VLVGDDVALGVVDEARALGLLALAALAEDPAAPARRRDGDLDDARRVALVDLADAERRLLASERGGPAPMSAALATAMRRIL